MHWALARSRAEQIAAKALLDELAAASEEEPSELVTEEQEAALRLENPKGKLLEHCVVLRLAPVFDVQPVLTSAGNAFEASVSITLSNGDELWSDLRRARSAKAAEQAAAASLLPQVLAATVSTSQASPAATMATMDARSALNEIRMRGGLRDYGFVLERMEGPPHAPVFFVKAFALRPSGARVEGPSVSATSKKEAERLAAERLFAELHAPAQPARF